MLTVKIPSPPIAKLQAYIDSNNLDADLVIKEYLAVVSNHIEHASGNALLYTDAMLKKDGLYATINVGRLPKYESMASLFDSLGFQQAMIEQINTGNRHYGDDCPIASPESLNKSLFDYPEKWLTIYLWTIVRAEYSGRFDNQTNAMISNAKLIDNLLEELGKNADVFGDFDPNDFASQCIDANRIQKILTDANNNAVELHCAGQSMTLFEVRDHRQKLLDKSTSELMTLIGNILLEVKTNDDFFKADNYYN
jgi:DNA-binding phage protein